MNLFTRTTAADQLEAVRGKLAAAELDVASAEQALRAGALSAALSDDPDFAEPLRAALTRARDRREMLAHAEQQAIEGVRQEQARAAAAIQATRNRSIRQRIGAITRAAKRYENATRECVQAYRDMVAQAGEANRLVPIGREWHGFSAELSPTRLTSHCLAELSRVGSDHPHRQDRGQPTAPAASYYGHDLDYGLTSVHHLPPLADRIQGRLLGHYRRLTGQAAPPPVTAPAARAPAGDPTVNTNSSAVSIAATPAAGKPAGAPVVPDFSRIHIDDVEKRLGTERELMILRGGARVVDIEADPIEEEADDLADIDPAIVEADPAATINETPALMPVEPDPARPSLGMILARKASAP